MDKKLCLYTIDSKYVNYLASFSPNIFKDDKPRKRKYIGIVLCVNSFSYFAPLTSFKKKHLRLTDSLDFLKIGTIAAINLNKMFPVSNGLFQIVDINSEQDSFYKSLLIKESRYLKTNAELIINNALILYEKVIKNPESKLAKRSNDFKLLEEACLKYLKS